ncbi:CbiQ family ECF transporter T component [Kineococcus indalonis]|uniref:CbiQ family ECF transporter T component n=1 Tax=Kineococcus indalonis TaxID=2696566 RepID=UPI001411F2A3|nr:CbiQ family ECF transporter T component [Kineococcus indalonis]NAZ85523.1 energy-coupling factor transporter transmembrane protein EcfT [Kineococcus indalonis]
MSGRWALGRRARWRRRGLDPAPPLLGRYAPGDSVLHRAGAGAKLAGLALTALAAGLVRSLAPPAPAAAVLLALAAGVAALALACGLGLAHLLTQLRRLAWVLVLLGAAQWWLEGPVRAVVVLTAVVVCVWAAATLTATTPVAVLLDAVVAGLRPLRRAGVRPGRVALLLTLAVSSIPVVAGLLAQSRAAAAARGLERDVRAVLVPTAVRTVAHAEALAEALAARGLDDGLNDELEDELDDELEDELDDEPGGEPRGAGRAEGARTGGPVSAPSGGGWARLRR